MSEQLPVRTCPYAKDRFNLSGNNSAAIAATLPRQYFLDDPSTPRYPPYINTLCID
jgi:hypothetical protein